MLMYTVAGGSVSACQKDGQTLVSPSADVTVGYLASASTTDHGGIGSSACPWRLQVTIITSDKEVPFWPEFVCLCVSKITQKVMEGSF